MNLTKAMKQLLFIIIVAAAGGCAATDNAAKMEISEVLVLDSGLRTVGIIDTPEKLAELNKLWHQLTPIEPTREPVCTRVLDVKTSRGKGRWLYSKEGYLAKVNRQLGPMYKVEDVEAFNRLVLGQ